MNTQFISVSLLLNVLYSNFLCGQNIGTVEISEQAIHSWEVDDISEYEGFYKFGEGEGESDLKLFFADSIIVGQIMEGYWEDDTDFWKWRFKNLTNIKIDQNGLFTSDQHTGQFVTYLDTNRTYFCLKINNPWWDWLDDGRFDVGVRLLVNARLYQGDYPQTSSRLLSIEELKNLNAFTLKIMRNEVYARYGYIFLEGSEMETYFKKTKWYRPHYKEVSNFLTEIELRNIQTIQRIEHGR